MCDNFLEKNVSTILYLTNSELFGRSTASSQYFLQLASYLGIPVIAWNADNSGLERRVRKESSRLASSLKALEERERENYAKNSQLLPFSVTIQVALVMYLCQESLCSVIYLDLL